MKKVILSACLLLSAALGFAQNNFVVRYLPLGDEPDEFNGKVVLFFSRRKQQPRESVDLFNPEPMMVAEVKGLKKGSTITLNESNLSGFPKKLSEIKVGRWYVQAVFDFNKGGRSIGTSPGNLFSPSERVDPSEDGTIELEARYTVEPQKFHETQRLRFFSFPSKLLSAFYGRPVSMKAGLLLPPEYDVQPDTKFSVLYTIPNYGTNSADISNVAEYGQVLRPNGTPMVVVMLEAECPNGHSGLVDSENNGPWAQALITEFLPALERNYRINRQPSSRFLTGHGLGGWAAFWLQVKFPETFNGVWCTAPAPLDFRSFWSTDLYASNANLFFSRPDVDRPFARREGRSLLTMRQESAMETPIRGEFLSSFEAMLSPKGVDGNPSRLWDRETGAILSEIASAWRQYDATEYLKSHWSELSKVLTGKLHFYGAENDTFFFDEPLRLFAGELKRLGSDAYVGFWKGDHLTVMTPDLLKHMSKSIGSRLQKLPGEKPIKG